MNWKKWLTAALLFPSSMFAQKFKPAPDWLKTATFYQIYPQSFKDSNGDGIGDINGITSKLDYIKWLGIDAIWLNPCFESSFQDAGYDVTDFYRVAKRYGSNADLKRLFEEAHQRNIKVCLDLVAGHTSIDHPWFRESQKAAKNEYTDRYIWTNDSTVKPERYVSGKFERNGNFRKNFFDIQPALNYGFANIDPTHPWEQPVTAAGPQATRKELMQIMDFWMSMGCDGFRVDMAPSLIKNDPDKTETNKLWTEIRQHFQSKFPQGILIAEWGNPSSAIKAGFMMDFIIHLGNDGYSSLFFNQEGTYRHDTCYFSKEGNGTPKIFVDYYLEQLKKTGEDGYLCVPTANHDYQRPHCGTRDSEDQLRTVTAFLMTIPGVPLFYYGDEIGMRFISGLPDKEGSMLRKGNRAGSRTPMQWDTSRGAGFSTADPDKFYLPIDSSAYRPNVEAEMANPSSLLHFNRRLLQLRKQYPALGTRGNIRFLYAEDKKYPLVYERTDGKNTFIIVINPADKEEKIALPYNGIANMQFEPVLENRVAVHFSEDQLYIDTGKVAYGVFKVNKLLPKK